MKREYKRPTVIITSYEAQSNIMLISGTTQVSFNTKNYTEVFNTRGKNF